MRAQHDLNLLYVGVDEVEQSLIEAFLGSPSLLVATQASSYEQVQALVDQAQPDVAICEVERYGLDVRRICADLLDKPCIFVSSRDRDIERRKCLLEYEDCYLTRPYSPQQFHHALERARHHARIQLN